MTEKEISNMVMAESCKFFSKLTFSYPKKSRNKTKRPIQPLGVQVGKVLCIE